MTIKKKWQWHGKGIYSYFQLTQQQLGECDDFWTYIDNPSIHEVDKLHIHVYTHITYILNNISIFIVNHWQFAH